MITTRPLTLTTHVGSLRREDDPPAIREARDGRAASFTVTQRSRRNAG